MSVPAPESVATAGPAWRVGPWHRRRLLLVMGLMAAVYLAGVTAQWWPTPDSALYIGLGRSLATGEGYRFNGQPHNTVAPGLPLLLAGLHWLVGPNFWAPNVLICLVGLAAACVVGRVFALVGGQPVGWAVGILTAGSYAFYLNAHRILSDAPFFLLFWLVVYACLRSESGGLGWLVLAGLLGVAGVIVRVPGLAALGVLGVSLLVQWRWPSGSPRPRAAALAILLPLALAAVGLLGLAYATSSATPGYARVLTLVGRQSLQRYLWHFTRAMADLPGETASLFTGQTFVPVGYALLGLGVAGSVLLWLRGQRLWAVMWILYPLGIAFLAGAGSIRVRYLLPVYPAMAYAALSGLEVAEAGVRTLLERFRPIPGLSRTVKVFMALALLANGPKVLRHAVWYSYLGHTSGYYGATQHGSYAGLPDLAEAIRQHTRPAGKVAARSDVRVLHLLTERLVIPFEPPRRAVADLAWLPADTDCIVLQLPEERNIAAACRKLAAARSPGLAKLFSGERYEAYRIVRP